MWGATTSEDYPATPYLRFQFTHPVWGATIGEGALRIAREGSIHAPRVGCDTSQSTSRASTAGFNSRTPCGVRQHIALASTKPISFNSRTPCGVRHKERPRATAQRTSFNSRTPCGVRRTYSAKPLPPTSVSIHAPRVGCDRSLVYTSTYLLVSIHAPRVGCDQRTA